MCIYRCFNHSSKHAHLYKLILALPHRSKTLSPAPLRAAFDRGPNGLVRWDIQPDSEWTGPFPPYRWILDPAPETMNDQSHKKHLDFFGFPPPGAGKLVREPGRACLPGPPALRERLSAWLRRLRGDDRSARLAANRAGADPLL